MTKDEFMRELSIRMGRAYDICDAAGGWYTVIHTATQQAFSYYVYPQSLDDPTVARRTARDIKRQLEIG